MNFVGEWVYGDTGKALLLTINLKDGSTPDYTTATGISLTAVCARPQASFTLAGAVSSGPSRIFSFASPGGTAASPGARRKDVYTARASYTYGGNVYWTDPFQFSVVAFP